MATAIHVENLSKRYHLGQRHRHRYRLLREAVRDVVVRQWHKVRHWAVADSNGRGRLPHPEAFWALKDVSFQVEEGEVVGIIGHNGAGKSTLLKILSRITEPTEGWAELRGRLGSLLEVGTGFHQELTGRENIYLNGSILGMKRREIDRRFDDIVDFAEIGPFLDTPVKNYSSGMFVRLAFAVAAHLEPEILIVDEVLAVGDIEFQKRCLGKMGEVAQSGRTILFVSHNMATVQNLCTKAILLARGRVQTIGDCKEVISSYLDSLATGGDARLPLAAHRPSGMMPIIQEVTVQNGEGQTTDRVLAGDPLTVLIRYDSPVPLSNPNFGVFFQTLAGEPLFHLQTMSQLGPLKSLPQRGFARCRMPILPLLPGTYVLSLNCSTVYSPESLDSLNRALTLKVEAADFYGTGRLPPARNGPFLVRTDWDFLADQSAEPPSVSPPSVGGRYRGGGVAAGRDGTMEIAD
jgi:lipopolysaccharide transport system ATP-binding protein